MDTTSTAPANPLLAEQGLPKFDAIRPEHVTPAVSQMLARAGKSFEELERSPGQTWAELMEPLEQINESLQRTWGPVSHLMGVQNSAELREVFEAAQEQVVDFGLRMGQSRPIFEAMQKLAKRPDLNQAQRRILELELRQMRHSGLELEGEEQKRFNEIARELSNLSTQFSNNVLDSTKAFALDLTDRSQIDGLPQSFLKMAAAAYRQAHADRPGQADPENGPWRVTLDGPSFLPCIQHAKNRELRERLYRAYIGRAASGEWDNTPLIQKILRLKREEARLLGFTTYAELSVADKMSGKVERVDAMHADLLSAALGPARADLRELSERAGKDGLSEIRHWDVAYYSERLREEKFDFTDEELRPYFPLPKVLEGMFGLVERLFGIRVSAANGEAPVWHPDVRYFKIIDQNGEDLASFYLDPYSRPADKRGGAWMDECLVRQRTARGLQKPVAHLVCNGTPPVGDQPSLLTFRETETLFHEFGHGLQHMLTTVDYASAAGIHGVEWDAVELPSQFMENWCYHKPTLDTLTAHVETGASLPQELYQKLLRARTFRAGSDLLRQLRFGMLDMELHHRYDPDGAESPFDVQRRIDEVCSLLPPLPEDRFLCSFGHIFAGGYAAGYYSYKWAEIMSADAFAAFEEAGLDNEEQLRATGLRFRQTVLAKGGSEHPAEVFRAFRGRDPQPTALLRHNGLKSA